MARSAEIQKELDSGKKFPFDSLVSCCTCAARCRAADQRPVGH